MFAAAAGEVPDSLWPPVPPEGLALPGCDAASPDTDTGLDADEPAAWS